MECDGRGAVKKFLGRTAEPHCANVAFVQSYLTSVLNTTFLLSFTPHFLAVDREHDDSCADDVVRTILDVLNHAFGTSVFSSHLSFSAPHT